MEGGRAEEGRLTKEGGKPSDATTGRSASVMPTVEFGLMISKRIGRCRSPGGGAGRGGEEVESATTVAVAVAVVAGEGPGVGVGVGALALIVFVFVFVFEGEGCVCVCACACACAPAAAEIGAEGDDVVSRIAAGRGAARSCI